MYYFVGFIKSAQPPLYKDILFTLLFKNGQTISSNILILFIVHLKERKFSEVTEAYFCNYIFNKLF